MRKFDASEKGKMPSHAGPHHTGALVLTLLAVAAFCGWYLMERDRPDDANPLPVVQKPIMPPTTTDTSSELPGHTHYEVFKSKDNASVPGRP
jgi:hypothetical protein